jgi:leucyl/phenylalanyl-tRNA--protein transferase
LIDRDEPAFAFDPTLDGILAVRFGRHITLATGECAGAGEQQDQGEGFHWKPAGIVAECGGVEWGNGGPCQFRSAQFHSRIVISTELLLHAYRNGVFPMAMDGGEIAWFSPDPRALIPLDDRFHVPHGLRRTLQRGQFEIRVDTAFDRVIRQCSLRQETWINPEIIASYVNLHRLGHAHSVETWLDGELVGGLYGVALGGAFFGESMFHEKTDASKVALHGLVERLRARGFTLLDTQWTTPHLERFGAFELPRAFYLEWLARALAQDCRFADESG